MLNLGLYHCHCYNGTSRGLKVVCCKIGSKQWVSSCSQVTGSILRMQKEKKQEMDIYRFFCPRPLAGNHLTNTTNMIYKVLCHSLYAVRFYKMDY